MELTLFKSSANVKPKAREKSKPAKKKKRFNVKRKLVSWSLTTILIMTAVMLIKRGFGTLIPSGGNGLFKRTSTTKKSK